jgi:NADH-quinone oxidoreductase subunit M
MRAPERTGLYMMMMLAGETATLGAFLAQDLLLFVLFFDLMIVPFYFLFGIWGEERDGVSVNSATMKMIVYTLIGSLLMLVGAIAIAVISADGGPITFSMAELTVKGLPSASQNWIFWFFAAAFLVKMPPSPHGWIRTPTAPRRCRPWPTSRRCCRRSAPTASCGWSCRSFPMPPSSSRQRF